MKKVTRRTKRMIAIIVVYMIVVINVIAAYASGGTTYYFVGVDENGEAVVKVYEPETEDSSSGSDESQEEQVAQIPEDTSEVVETPEYNPEDFVDTDPVEEVTDTEDANIPTEPEDSMEPEASTGTSEEPTELVDSTELTDLEAKEPASTSDGSSETGNSEEVMSADINVSGSQGETNTGADENQPVPESSESNNDGSISIDGENAATTDSESNSGQPVTDGTVSDKQVLEEAKNNIENLLEDIGKVDNFVIYADNYSTTTHIDGNIAVNNYSHEADVWEWNQEKNTTEVKKYDTLETIKGTGDNYSYIGSTNSDNGLVIGTYDNQGEGTKPATNVATLVVGDENIKIQNNNGGAKTVNIGDIDPADLNDPEKKADVEAALEKALEGRNIDAEKFLDEIQIDKNLNEIAEQGEAAKEAVDQIWADENGNKKLNNVEASKKVAEAATGIVNAIANEEVKDAIIVFDVDVNALNDSRADGLPKIIENLIKANKEIGATIVINMVIPEGDLNTEINFCVPINSDAYAEETAYVVWNFGNYNGQINVNQTIAGIVVAPDATVVANGVINGRVIADDMSHSMEIHTPRMPEKTPEPTPEPTAPPTPEPTAPPTPEPTAPPTPEPTAPPTPEPTAPPTPEPTAPPTPEPTAPPTPEPTATAVPSTSPEASTSPSAVPSTSPEASTSPSAVPSTSPEASTSPSAVPSTSPEASTSPSATPGLDETPTPDTTPAPSEAPTPGTTPGDEPTPPPTPEEGPTPPPTPEEGPTPPPTPGDEPTPAPGDEPTPEITVVTPAPEIPAAQVPTGTVLGARRIQESGTRAAVLGARRGSNYAVLGKRRRPATGDSVAMLVWVLALAAAIGGALTSIIALRNSKKE